MECASLGGIIDHNIACIKLFWLSLPLKAVVTLSSHLSLSVLLISLRYCLQANDRGRMLHCSLISLQTVSLALWYWTPTGPSCPDISSKSSLMGVNGSQKRSKYTVRIKSSNDECRWKPKFQFAVFYLHQLLIENIFKFRENFYELVINIFLGIAGFQ